MGNSLLDILSSPAVHSFVFLGEAGCGKSELAVNTALELSSSGRSVSFFDLDMTKPLFRSRDLDGELIQKGVDVFYQEQFADAPTTGGWIEVELRKKDRYCIFDVGGDYMGSRALGGCSSLFLSSDSAVFYIINPYRPWSDSVVHIDTVLSGILSAIRLPLEKVKFLANPYLGPSTTSSDIIKGYKKLLSQIGEYVEISAMMVPEDLRDEIRLPVELISVEKKIIYPW